VAKGGEEAEKAARMLSVESTRSAERTEWDDYGEAQYRAKRRTTMLSNGEGEALRGNWRLGRLNVSLSMVRFRASLEAKDLFGGRGYMKTALSFVGS